MTMSLKAETSQHDLQIRRLCRAHLLPAHSTIDLPKRYSLVRRRRQH